MWTDFSRNMATIFRMEIEGQLNVAERRRLTEAIVGAARKPLAAIGVGMWLGGGRYSARFRSKRCRPPVEHQDGLLHLRADTGQHPRRRAHGGETIHPAFRHRAEGIAETPAQLNLNR